MNEHYSTILTGFFDKMTSWEEDIVRDTDISLAQMHLLEVLGNHGGMRMKELADRLGVTTGTLTVNTRRMIKKGLIVKKQDEKDRRSYFINLSPRGKSEYEKHHELHSSLTEEIVLLLGEKESNAFFSRLERIQTIL